MSTQASMNDSNSMNTARPQAQNLVLIASDNPDNAAFIGAQLEQSGFDTRIAIYDGKTLKGAPRTPPRAILVSISKHVNAARDIVSSLKTRYASHDPVIIGAVPQTQPDLDDVFDSVIYAPAHPAQIAARITAMIRLSAMQREITLRIETLSEDFGIDYTFGAPVTNARLSVLFIGKASPEFMVVINALDRRNVDVVAAFTSFSAFDFMHENSFDAVVMNMIGSPEPALSISAAMRRNAKLYHTPALLLTGEDFGAHDHAYAKGATDIIPYGSSSDEISGRIIELANYNRLHSGLKAEFSSLGGLRCIESASGTYNQKFFYAHLRRVINADKHDGFPTSIMLVRIDRVGDKNIDEAILQGAYDQIGSMIKNMVRMEDMAARLGNNLYAIAFPSQYVSAVKLIASRLSGAIDSIAFPTGKAGYDSYQLALDCRISDCQSQETITGTAGAGHHMIAQSMENTG